MNYSINNNFLLDIVHKQIKLFLGKIYEPKSLKITVPKNDYILNYPITVTYQKELKWYKQNFD